MSGSEDIVGLLREDALRLDEAGDEDRPVDGPHSIAARVREALDLIDRLTTENARIPALEDIKVAFAGQLADISRLSEQVEKQGKVVRAARKVNDMKTPGRNPGPYQNDWREARVALDMTFAEYDAALNGLVVVGEGEASTTS